MLHARPLETLWVRRVIAVAASTIWIVAARCAGPAPSDAAVDDGGRPDASDAVATDTPSLDATPADALDAPDALDASDAGPRPRMYSADLIVYGATPAGIAAAVAAHRAGRSVRIVEPGSHVGGMVTGGISSTDIGNANVVGGLAREYFSRVGLHYGETVTFRIEPHVAQSVLDAWLVEEGITVDTGQRLREHDGVSRSGTAITAMTTGTGDVYQGTVFIDATYEGDLMAQAHVSYTYGRESSAQYAEPHNGIRPWPTTNPPIPASRPDGGLWPEVEAHPPGVVGAADPGIQSFNYRFCITDVAANRGAWIRPAGYDPARFGLLGAEIRARETALGRSLTITDILTLYDLGRGKKDLNNLGLVSTDYVNGNVGFVDGSYALRATQTDATRDYDLGLLYFLANDPSVSAGLRASMNTWGPALDEWPDHGNFPTQLYIREARRMIGDFVMTESDVTRGITVATPDPIGMGSYNLDCHNVHRFVDTDGFAHNEGGMGVHIAPYQIPYRLVLPRRTEVTNLLVPVAFSASHVAYLTLRMEPQYMIIGQAAGLAAATAIEQSMAVQAIDPTALTQRLREQGVRMEINAWEVVVDDAAPSGVSRTGGWESSTAIPGYNGRQYWTVAPGAGAASMVFSPAFPSNGPAKLYARWTAAPNRASNAQFRVTRGDGTVTDVVVDQRTDGGVWHLLGTFDFHAGRGGTIELRNAGADGYVVADAIRVTAP